MEWTPLTVTIFVLALPLMVIVGMALVPIILGIVCIAFGALVIAANFILLPFGLAIGAFNEWRWKKAKQDELDEIHQWGRDNPEALDWARKNPGGVPKSKDEENVCR